LARSKKCFRRARRAGGLDLTFETRESTLKGFVPGVCWLLAKRGRKGPNDPI